MSLPAHLHDADYRDQHANKPKPASEQKRELFSVNNRDRRQRGQERSTTSDGQERKEFFRIRIKNSEIDWPDQLTQIDGVANDCIFETQRQRESEGVDLAVLGQYCGNGRGCSKQGEGNLFQKQRNHFLLLKSIQWPVID